MKYAIISDIHGNFPALEAVLADSKACGADMYLLLGDYTTCFPWGNEVVETIRKLNPSLIIRGNGEGYFIDYINNRFDLNNEQFKPAYWDYSSLSKENLEYLINLPERTEISGLDCNIHLSHTVDMVHHKQVAKFFHPTHFRTMMSEAPITHDEYLARAKEALLSCPEAIADILALPKGIHIFGHNHIQFHMEHEGRLFVNPGSCGQSLDFDTTAAYTILTHTDNSWDVIERRVEYDINSVVEKLDSSGFSECSPVWSKVIAQELTTAKNHMTPFVMHLMETGRKLGRSEYPVSKEVWEAGVRTWNKGEIQ